MKHDHLRIRQLARKGLSWTEIMEAVGCSRDTVWRALSDDPEHARELGRNRVRKTRRSQLCNGPNSA